LRRKGFVVVVDEIFSFATLSELEHTEIITVYYSAGIRKVEREFVMFFYSDE